MDRAGKSKSQILEETLMKRLEERVRDGEACEEVQAFFESKEDMASGIPLLMARGKRKQRTIRPGVGGVARREGPDDGAERSGNPPYPPITNRGVTFNGPPSKSSDQHSTASAASSGIMGGYDGGVEVGFDGKWHEIKWKKVLQTLEAAKLAAIVHRDGGGNLDEERFFVLGGWEFVMSPNASSGKVCYSFVFEGEGVKFYIHANPKGGIQPVRIRYDATGLIGRDLFLKHREIRDFLKSIGFMVQHEKLSRVDFQVMVYRDVSEFFGAIFEQRFVCKAWKWAMHGSGARRGCESFRIGGNIQSCIYDKRAELLASMQKDAVKFALMVQNCFGEDWLTEEIPTTRIEFRMKRKALRDFGIETMEDLMERENGMVRILCDKWFRLLAESRVEGHTHEQEVAECWREVQEAFDMYFPGVDGHRIDPVRERKTGIRCTVDHLKQQALGCMATASALTFGVVEQVTDVLRFVVDTFDENGQKLFDRAVDRGRELCIKTGLVPVSGDRSLIETSCIMPDRNAFFEKMVPIMPKRRDPDDFDD